MAQVPERHVQLRLIAEHSQVKGGETVLIGIEQTIAPHWHTYWVNPGDSGEPMRIKWDLPPGFAMSDLRWPMPERIQIGPLVSFGYHDRAIPLQKLTLPENLPDGPIVLKATAETLVCDEICIPENDELTLTLNEGGTADSSALLSDAVKRLPSGAVVTGGAFRERPDGLFEATIPWTDDRMVADIFPYDWGMMANEGQPQTSTDKGTLVIRHKRGERALTDLGTFRILVVTTDKAGNHAAFDAEAKPNPATVPTQKKTEGSLKAVTLYAALALALFGGVVLNLMPCVFPVLSMKALSLVKMADKGDSHARQYGLMYTAGILVCFALVAGTLIALKSGGAQIGWGFQLQNPLVVLLLSWLLFTVGLNFSGMFEIGGSFTNVGANLAGREGLKGSFFTGMLAAVVATPCTAPFMGAAIGYAMVQSPAVSLAVFMALGLGLALPYLLICFLPSLRRLLPKPGHWMQTLREFLAFPMYASAAWLAWVYTMQTGADGILSVLSGMVLLAMIFWLAARMPEKGALRVLALLFGIALVGTLGSLAWSATQTYTAPATEQGDAEAFTPQRLATLLDGNEPVFVNMTAAWCITCKINERAALSIAETRTLFRERNVRYLKGDWTSRNADITSFLAGYGRNGVPLYVYYGARSQNGMRPDPVILPQILTPSIVRNVVMPPETKP